MRFEEGEIVVTKTGGTWFEPKSYTESQGKIIFIDEMKESYLVDFTMERRIYYSNPFHHEQFGNSKEKYIAWFDEYEISKVCSKHDTGWVYHDKKEEYICPFCDL